MSPFLTYSLAPSERVRRSLPDTECFRNYEVPAAPRPTPVLLAAPPIVPYLPASEELEQLQESDADADADSDVEAFEWNTIKAPIIAVSTSDDEGVDNEDNEDEHSSPTPKGRGVRTPKGVMSSTRRSSRLAA